MAYIDHLSHTKLLWLCNHHPIYIYIYIYIFFFFFFYIYIIYIYIYIISRYEHDIKVIAQDQGNDLDIIRVNQDITNLYPMQIEFLLVDLIDSN